MNNTIIKKLEVLAAVIIITFLIVSSLCYSQSVLILKGENTERLIQKYEFINQTDFSKQINESVKYRPDNSSPLPMDTILIDTSKNDAKKNTTDEKIVKANDTAKTEGDKIKPDSTRYNMFGDLLNDDTIYNLKYPLWRPITGILEQHVVQGLFNRYIANVDYGRVGFNSWSHNIQTGWEWDLDRFGMNFLAHPFSGGSHFITGRANGYNFWQSVPFAFAGSLLWEYFGENTLPSKNDIINTTISGAFY